MGGRHGRSFPAGRGGTLRWASTGQARRIIWYVQAALWLSLQRVDAGMGAAPESLVFLWPNIQCACQLSVLVHVRMSSHELPPQMPDSVGPSASNEEKRSILLHQDA